MNADDQAALTGRCILLVEDEYFVAADMARSFKASGASVVGPAARVDDAMGLIDEAGRLDGAVLDINLQGEMVYGIADLLIGTGVPFVFATGYDPSVIPPWFAHVPRCEKPVDPRKIARALFPEA